VFDTVSVKLQCLIVSVLLLAWFCFSDISVCAYLLVIGPDTSILEQFGYTSFCLPSHLLHFFGLSLASIPVYLRARLAYLKSMFAFFHISKVQTSHI
jgi:hypothetical protein